MMIKAKNLLMRRVIYIPEYRDVTPEFDYG